MLDDTAILKQARQGNQQAITQLVMSYQHMVRNYLYALAPDPSIGDDLAQEVFVRFFRSIDRIDAKKGIKAYLMTIARNMAIDYWRKTNRRKEKFSEILFSDLESYFNTVHEPSPPQIITQKFKALKKCLKKLNGRIYRIIQGFYYDNLKCRELADLNDTSETNIRSLLYRGRKTLFKCIVKRIKKYESIE